MSQPEKIVGTTFAFQEQGAKTPKDFRVKLVETELDVPVYEGDAFVIPEPTNPYDPNAIAVGVPLVDGQAFRIGYLAKNSPYYEETKTQRKGKFRIVAYSQKDGNLSDSYQIKL